MPLQVYGEGKTGEIYIEDERPDGSVVLLVCSEAVTRQPYAAAAPQSYAAASPQDDEPSGMVGVAASSSTDGSVYPMFREHDMARSRFKLHVDTTNLAGGIIRFAMAPFTRASLRAADAGHREVHLDASNAEEWGYLGSGPEPVYGDGEEPSPSPRPARRSTRGGSTRTTTG